MRTLCALIEFRSFRDTISRAIFLFDDRSDATKMETAKSSAKIRVDDRSISRPSLRDTQPAVLQKSGRTWSGTWTKEERSRDSFDFLLGDDRPLSTGEYDRGEGTVCEYRFPGNNRNGSPFYAWRERRRRRRREPNFLLTTSTPSWTEKNRRSGEGRNFSLFLRHSGTVGLRARRLHSVLRFSFAGCKRC